MAKKEVRIPIKVDGKEILLTQKEIKKLAKETTKASKGFDAMSTSQQGADRAAKGLTRQSSNQTKNFSKIQQGISGGLVPAYATLAAQVFAVSAAFQFLKTASDFKNLIQGQQAYAGLTGSMYSEVARSIRTATAAQISYTEASQAAAIGTAAGLSSDQLTKLGTAAKNVSLALGRDVTDSFNRLVRGVTKAEPELLDELGIILRLDPALKEYATSIGKAKESLNAYERSQAIANFVLDQADKKFGAIGEKIDPTAFALNQFGQAFNDLLDKLKEGLGGLAQTVLPFFTKNITSLIAALTLFSVPILKSILPNFGKLAVGLATSAEQHKTAFASMKKDIIEYDIMTQALRADPKAKAKFQSQGMKGVTGVAKEAGYVPKGKDGEFTNQQLGQIKRHLKKRTGLFAKHNAERVAVGQAALKKLDIAEAAHQGRVMSGFDRTNRWLKLQWLRLVRNWKGAMSMMATAAKWGARAINFAFTAVAIFGIATLIYDLGRTVLGLDKVDEKAQQLKETFKEIQESSSRQSKQLVEQYKNQLQGLIAIEDQAKGAANAIQSIGLEGKFKELKELFGPGSGPLTDEKKGAARALAKTFEDLANVQTRTSVAEVFRSIASEIRTYRGVSESTIKTARKLTGEFVGQAQSASMLDESMKSVNQSLSNFIGQAGGKYTTFLQNLDTAIQNQIDKLVILKESAEKANKEMQGIAQDNPWAAFAIGMAQIKGGAGFGNIGKSEIQQNEDNLAFLEKTREEVGKLQLADTNRLKSLSNINNQLATQEKTYSALDKYNSLDLMKQKLETENTAATNAKNTASAIYNFAVDKLGVDNELTKFAKAQYDLAEQQVTTTKNLTAEKVQQLKIDAQRALYAEAITNQLKLQANQEKLRDLQYQSTGGAGVRMFAGTDIGANIQANFTRADRLAAITAQQSTITSGLGVRMEGESDQAFALRQQDLKMKQEELNILQKKIELEGTFVGMLESSFGTAAGQLSGNIASGAVGVLKGEKSGGEAIKEIAESFAETMITQLIQQFTANILAKLLGEMVTQGVTTTANTTALATNTAALGALTAAVTLDAATPLTRYGGILNNGVKLKSFRYGGMSAEDGGIMQGKQSGYNVTMHGKEAVIPLGTGQNAIPVVFKNGAPSGATNSVVNVTINSDGSTQMDEREATQFGQAIQSAVQSEIAKQQRSGGLLDNTLGR